MSGLFVRDGGPVEGRAGSRRVYMLTTASGDGYGADTLGRAVLELAGEWVLTFPDADVQRLDVGDVEALVAGALGVGQERVWASPVGPDVRGNSTVRNTSTTAGCWRVEVDDVADDAPAWAADVTPWGAVGAVEERTCSRVFGVFEVQVVQVRDEAGNVTTTAVEVASDAVVWTGPLVELVGDFERVADEVGALVEALRGISDEGSGR